MSRYDFALLLYRPHLRDALSAAFKGPLILYVRNSEMLSSLEPQALALRQANLYVPVLYEARWSIYVIKTPGLQG